MVLNPGRQNSASQVASTSQLQFSIKSSLAAGECREGAGSVAGTACGQGAAEERSEEEAAGEEACRGSSNSPS